LSFTDARCGNIERERERGDRGDREDVREVHENRGTKDKSYI